MTEKEIENVSETTLTPSDVASEFELGEKLAFLDTRLPRTARILWSHCPVEELARTINELYDFVRKVEAPETEEDLESCMPDGGLYQEGGLTAGGIFGDAPIALSDVDPGAESRSVNVRTHRAVLGEGVAPGLDGPKQLSPHRRQKLLAR